MPRRPALLAAAGGRPFSPSDLAGLALWLDASDASTLWTDTSATTHATAAGAAVARWDDKSGNGRHATQSTSGSRPALNLAAQNSRNVLYFDGTDDGMQIGSFNPSTVMSSGFSIYAVAKLNAASSRTWSWIYGSTPTFSAAALMLGKSGNGGDVIHYGAPGWHNGVNTSVGPIAGAYHTYGHTEDSATTRLILDGAETTDVNGASTLSSTDFYIGSRAGTEPWIGPIPELIVCSQVHGSTVRAQVQAYLKAKWGTP